MERITGKLLGDGCITKQPGRKPRFQFMHKTGDQGWAWHCYEQLRDFLPLAEPKYKHVPDPRVDAGFTECYFVQSRTSEQISLLEEVWYTDRVKQIPKDMVEELLTEEALAWWYQDDGHLKQDNGIPRKIILSTDSFTREENDFLVSVLKGKFFLTFSIDRQNRLILYDQFQIKYFLRLVEPYMHPSMKRKQLTGQTSKQLAKVTTLYLPVDMKILRPTAEINQQLMCLPKLAIQLKERDGHIQFYRQFYLLSGRSGTRAYRIIINKDHKQLLAEVQAVLGWSNSKIVEWCFRNALRSKSEQNG